MALVSVNAASGTDKHHVLPSQLQPVTSAEWDPVAGAKCDNKLVVTLCQC